MNVKNIIGRLKVDPSQGLGYFLWKQSDGFHLRWNTEGKKEFSFQGKVICQDKMKITKKVRQETSEDINESEKNTIIWNTKLKNDIDGVDFLTPGNFTLELRINKKKVKTKNIFLGPKMIQPEKNPFLITQISTEKKLIIEKVKPKKEPKRKIEEEIKKLEPEPAPISEPTPEPTPEPQSALISEPIPEPQPVAEPVYEPTSESEPAPISEPTPEPTPEPQPALISEPIPEPQPVAEPVYEPTSEPEPAPISEPIPEPESKPERDIIEWLTQLQAYRTSTPIDNYLKESIHEIEAESEKLTSQTLIKETLYESLPEPKPDHAYQTESKPLYEPEAKFEPEFKPKSEPILQSEPEYKPEPEPVWQAEPAYVAGAKIEPEYKPEPTYEAGAKIEPEYKPEPEPIWQPVPEYKPEPESVWQPEPVLEPKFERDSESTPKTGEKVKDEAETRIIAWLSQLKSYRKFE